jgi:hypothetical protein
LLDPLRFTPAGKQHRRRRKLDRTPGDSDSISIAKTSQESSSGDRAKTIAGIITQTEQRFRFPKLNGEFVFSFDRLTFQPVRLESPVPHRITAAVLSK